MGVSDPVRTSGHSLHPMGTVTLPQARLGLLALLEPAVVSRWIPGHHREGLVLDSVETQHRGDSLRRGGPWSRMKPGLSRRSCQCLCLHFPSQPCGACQLCSLPSVCAARALSLLTRESWALTGKSLGLTWWLTVSGVSSTCLRTLSTCRAEVRDCVIKPFKKFSLMNTYPS